MLSKLLLMFVAVIIKITATGQSNFQYTPRNPKAGDVITITYEPAGAIAGTIKPVEAEYYLIGQGPSGVNNINADDIPLKRNGKKFTGTFKTDTAANAVYLGFSSDKKYDNNSNEGYHIILNDEGGNPKKGAYAALSTFYQYFGSRVGVDRDNEKALAQLEKELSSYAESRKTFLPEYARLVSSTKEKEAVTILLKEIEAALKKGMNKEEDYQLLESLYTAAKLPQQAKLITQLKKEKFPQGKWIASETMQKFNIELDIEKKEQMLAAMRKSAETDANWQDIKEWINSPYHDLQIAQKYAKNSDWVNYRRITSGIKNKDELSSHYNNLAWGMQEKNENLTVAEEISRFATFHAKNEWKKPTENKPPYLTTKQWENERKHTYAMYADTYAMVLFRQGEYKKALPYAKEAAIVIKEGKDPEYNKTYALIAEKAIPARLYKKELEDFVKNGKSTSEIKEILKSSYIKDKGSEEGFDNYIVALERESYLKMIEELRKSMLNTTAPSFELLDLDGKQVNLSDLKGKTVVVDFWATWCGPCIASFPGMQKAVTKYKDDPNVKFIFIDTWESGDDVKKKVSDFIVSNKYTFHVLMDSDNKVVEQFKVDGIPTKFVIDKDGIIRFKSVGFNGSDDKIVSELSAMIEMASAPQKKSF